MGFYSELASTASALIAEFGAAATLKKQAAGAYNVATGAAAVTVTTYAVQCAVFDFPDRAVDNTLVLASDKDCYMSVKGGVAPALNDVVNWGGVDYTVVRFKPLSPALIAVLWQVQMR